MQDLALFAIPRGYLEGDTDGGSLAGVGAASLGRLATSNAPSSLHHTSSNSRSSRNNSRRWGPIDIEACVKALDLGHYRFPREAQDPLVNILFETYQDEDGVLSTNQKEIMDWVHTLTEHPLRPLATSILGGRWGANGFWSAGGVDYYGTPELWWNMICRLLVGRTNAAYWLLRNRPEIKDWVDKALKGSGQPIWVRESLRYVALNGRMDEVMTVQKDGLEKEVEELHTKLHGIDRSEASRQSIMTWYLTQSDQNLRRLFQEYMKLYSDGDMLVELSTFLSEDTVQYNTSQRRNEELTTPDIAIRHYSRELEIIHSIPCSI
jgi:hypothetical protein